MSIVSFNFYYGNAGLAESVLRQRLRACDVREDLGLPRGRVLVRESGSTDLPDVIWELRFEDVSGHESDMAVRAASPEFEAVRAGMRKLCRRFERPLFEVHDSAGAASAVCDRMRLDWVFTSGDGDTSIGERFRAARLNNATDGCELLRLVTPGVALPEWMVKQDCSADEGAESYSTFLAGLANRIETSTWSFA